MAIASQAGSGKALLPVLGSLVSRGDTIRAFLAPGVIGGSQELLGDTGQSLALETVDDRLNVEDLLESFSPHGCLVGTTATESPERRLTLAAADRAVRTVAPVDERYGFGRRFADEGGALRYVPDVVAVMDDECAVRAVAEGVPASRVRVTGSPMLSHLAHHAADMYAEARREHPALGSLWKRVVFVSERFARDNGSSPGSRGRLGDFLGFTEHTVRQDLIAILREIGREVVLTERLHPSDDSATREAWVESNLYWEQVKDGDLWRLLVSGDVVVGMRSMALLEAALLGCRVASYQPNLIGEDQCAAVRFGAAARLRSQDDLKAWLMGNLLAETRHVPSPVDLPFLRRDAAVQVAALLSEERPDRP